MKRFKNILVVVADDVPSDSVFQWISCLSRHAEAEAVDFAVFTASPEEMAVESEQAAAMRREFMTELGQACAGFLEDTRLNLLERTGETLPGVLEMLLPGTYDLVVVPVSGRRSRQLTERLARKSPVGVLMVPETAVVPPRRVVAALDFSELTGLVVDWAEAFATLHPDGAEKEAVHVVDPTIPGRATLVREESKLLRDIRDTARWQLTEALSQHAREGSSWKSLLLEGQLPGTALADHAAAEADLLVAGCHGRNALALALMGSNTADLLRESEKPVLVVKQKNRNLGFLRQLLGKEG
ncbi:MAG: universal stress protein [Akkermansiaceae bacterium]|jgi:nucleotide-binding universal stress UspA family protein|nr:universal stress protein [Akkermansiaceae bacterium]